MTQLPHLSQSPSASSSSSTSHRTHAFSTRTIHVGSEPSLSPDGGVSAPIQLSSTFYQPRVGQLLSGGFEYGRSGNPTRKALERALASLEEADEGLREALKQEGSEGGEYEEWVRGNGEGAVAFASGSSATATVVQALVGAGGHIVSVGDVYGGSSRYFLKVAGPIQGAETTFVDLSYRTAVKGADGAVQEKGHKGKDGGEETEEEQDRRVVERLEGALRPETKVIWIETPTNPMLNLVPIRLISRVAQSHSIPLVIDNTFASPYLQSPLSLGATVVVASSTKYISGHSDVLGGYIASSSPSLLSKFRFLQNAHGAVPSPFDCYLLLRSLKTLALRVRQHSLNGLAVARYLEEVARPLGLVRDVRYPGLRRAEETPAERRERMLAWEQLTPEFRSFFSSAPYNFSVDSPGGFPCGGMVTFHITSPYPGSQEIDKKEVTATAERFLESLEVFTLAESLGGVESLAELPVRMTHGGVDPTHRASLGIDGELIRLSVGVEEVGDLVRDVEQALKKAVGAVEGVKANGVKANGVKKEEEDESE
ncbi:hypothetical protein JCM8547_000602 [Rhodosporidiobolus lusitaniae]